MGGTGGGFFHGSAKPEELSRRVRDAETQARDEQYEAQAADVIGQLLTAFNDRDVEGIQRHLTTIEQALGKDIDGSVDLLFGGSVAKHTYIDGLSDVDALVTLGGPDFDGLSPEEARELFVKKLKLRLPNTEITHGQLAVTVKLAQHEIQLLPAIRTETGFKISDASGQRWSSISPDVFARQLTDANQRNGGKVIPTIKMAKSLIAGLPENRQLSGYHIEALAVQIFKTYSGNQNTKDMLVHFFKTAPTHVLYPIPDTTGQSSHVDAHLGPNGSVARQIVADGLARLGRRMQNADGAKSVAQWKDIVGDAP